MASAITAVANPSPTILTRVSSTATKLRNTTDMIAAAADVAPRTFFSDFQSKEDAMLACVRRGDDLDRIQAETRLAAEVAVRGIAAALPK